MTTLTRVMTSAAQTPRARWIAGLVVGLLLALSTQVGSPFAGRAAAEPGGCDVKPGADAGGVIPWAQERLGFDAVHRFATGKGVTVAVIDSGLTQIQPQTKRIAISSPTNVMGAPYGATDIYDCEDYGHGTRVAAIIAAPAQAGEGFLGLAPDATIMPIKYYDSSTQDVGGDSAAVARGIQAAVSAGVDVINLSLQAPDTPELRASVASALAADIVIVASSGNDTGEGIPVQYPAKYAEEEQFPHVLVVGAVDNSDQVATFSITGSYLGVTAPGTQIVAPTQIKGYFSEDGTSFATPFVSATVALVRQTHRRMSAAEVVNRIKATADRPGVTVPDVGYGWGIVNPYLAVTAERDDSRILPKPEVLDPVSAPDLPAAPDRTLRNLGFSLAAGLLGLALLFAIASTVVRQARER